ncbi:MAG: N-acetylmuramoyl-L-alanine amidase [Bacillota bacterium]
MPISEKEPIPVNKLILFISVVVCFLLFSASAAMAAGQATVKGSYINLRAGPSTGNAIVGKAFQGEKMEVLSARDGWYQVKKGNLTAWVAGWLVSYSGSSSQLSDRGSSQAVVKVAYVNLRESPSTASRILAKAVQGERMDILSSQNGWYRVKKGSTTAWVAGWLVETRQAATQEKTVDTAKPASHEVKASTKVEVTGERVNIRSGPGTGNKIVGNADRGTVYKVQDKSGSWYKVALSSGAGWIYGELVKLVKEETPIPPARPETINSSRGVVTGSLVNIRSGPGTNYGVMSRAGQGERLPLLDKSGDWYKVSLQDGRQGWIVAWLLEEDRDVSPGPPQGGSGNTSSGSTGQIQPPPRDDSEKPAEKPAEQKPAEKPADTPSESGQEKYLKSVSARIEGTGTVLTIESDGAEIQYSTTTLYNPDRLVIDIQGLKPGSVLESITLNSTLVDKIRVGLFNSEPAVTRVVVDLKARMTYKRSLSSSGDRLKITIIPRGSRTIAGSKIVLDAGHGGSDPGAIGPSGLKEKVVNLDITLKAAQILRSKGATVLLTRTGDTYIDLYERPEIANRNEADLFVSIHSNANPSRSHSGTSTYFLREPGEGMEDVRIEGMYLARSIQASLLNELKREDKGVLQANFAVLTRSQVPAALAEVAFLSNYEEEKLLGTDQFRLKAAEAIVEGIENYLKAN